MSSLYPDLQEERKADSGSLAHDLPSTELIGSIAGRIWIHLNLQGRTSVLKLKSEIPCSAALLHLSLGWLLREDKVRFSKKNGSLFVELK